MTSGHYFSIQSFREVYTVSQTTLVKLIVITNCKDLNLFFFLFFFFFFSFLFFLLAATSPSCVVKVTYILVLEKKISLLATGC